MYGRFPDAHCIPKEKVKRIILELYLTLHTGFLSIVNENLMGIGLGSYIVKYCNRYLLDDCILNSYLKWNSLW